MATLPPDPGPEMALERVDGELWRWVYTDDVRQELERSEPMDRERCEADARRFLEERGQGDLPIMVKLG